MNVEWTVMEIAKVEANPGLEAHVGRKTRVRLSILMKMDVFLLQHPMLLRLS